MHEPDDFPEVEDDDLAPATCRTQRPPDESPPELFWLYVGHVGSEDGGPQNLATHRKLGHILRDDGDLGQLGHLRSSKERLDVAGDTVLVHARYDPVGSFADLAGHTSHRDPVPGEAEHIYVVVGVAEGEDTLGLYLPPLAQEPQGRSLSTLQVADPDVVRQAARDEEPPGEGRLRLPERVLYIVRAVHDHELRRFLFAFPEPVCGGVHDGDSRVGVTPRG